MIATTAGDKKKDARKSLEKCKVITDKYMQFIKDMGSNEYSTSRAYRLMGRNTSAVVELYRLSLLKAFGLDYSIPYRCRSLEVVLDDCTDTLREALSSENVHFKNEKNKFVFIQACLTCLTIHQG